jgi:hypothetical protein
VKRQRRHENSTENHSASNPVQEEVQTDSLPFVCGGLYKVARKQLLVGSNAKVPLPSCGDGASDRGSSKDLEMESVCSSYRATSHKELVRA